MSSHQLPFQRSDEEVQASSGDSLTIARKREVVQLLKQISIRRPKK